MSHEIKSILWGYFLSIIWNTYRWKYQQVEKLNFYSIVVWCDIYCTSIIDLGGFPIGSNAFSYTGHLKRSNALWSRSPIKAEEWGTSLLCHAHRTPLSVRQSCSPNKCPHPAVSHCGCREKVSDNLAGEMRHLHQIINTLTDRRQSVLLHSKL